MYGGNRLTSYDLSKNGKQLFADSVYTYFFYKLQKSEVLKIFELKTFSVYVLTTESTNFVVNGEAKTLSEGDLIQVENSNIELENNSGVAGLLIAGVSESKSEKEGVFFFKHEELYKVVKPWGHELWINGEHPDYALKQIFIKKGTKTSLQYHNFKQETNLLLEGEAKLHFNTNSNKDNNDVVAEELATETLTPITAVDVTPKIIHRLEAVTDILLYEVSTPHLNDVIRLQDDSKRKDGRLEEEHKAQVCILTSGIGSRMGGLTDVVNKALLPVRNKAVISWIIEMYPQNSRFVISLGYKGDQVKNYLLAAYPGYDFIFTTVDNYDQPGAGPGYSLMQCKQYLGSDSFYFSVCDALFEGDIPTDRNVNWVGVADVNYAISQNYCNFSLEGNSVKKMIDKEPYPDNHSKSFVGLCYIKDADIFWKGLEDKSLHKNEYQMTKGIDALINAGEVVPVNVDWTDVGSYQKYVEIIKEEGKFNFSKLDEYIYFVNNRIVKFFNDANITKSRVEKTQYNKGVFPEIEFYGGQFYSYSFIDGSTLYEKCNNEMFANLLEWLTKNVHIRKDVDLENACLDFYKSKTLKRLDTFYKKYPDINGDTDYKINGRYYGNMNNLINIIDWNIFTKGYISSFFHGDLQFDNILSTGTNEFKLIDWRQDFGGIVEVGDLYYDLAKLYGGLILNYDIIKNNLFEYDENELDISYDFYTRNSMRDYIRILEDYITSNGFDLKKVKLLVGIIYLNMSPLHHYPFDKMLFFLSTKMLSNQLNNESK
jgi:NDP-sugar pyrophosphorylase family protein/mannose-6-phosphate isomerase-like protein (cupin superfamily)